MPPDDKAEIVAALKRLSEQVAGVRDELASLDAALRGDLDGKPGLLARMTAIEAAEARRDRVVCAAVVAVAGAIGHAVWQVIVHRP